MRAFMPCLVWCSLCRDFLRLLLMGNGDPRDVYMYPCMCMIGNSDEQLSRSHSQAS